MTVVKDRRYGFVGDLAAKAPVDCATTGNIALTGLQLVDGFQTFENFTDPLCRVFVWQQTNPAENGLYNPSTGIWTRCVDWNGPKDFVKGTRIHVNSGSLYGNSDFELITEGAIIVGTTGMQFNQLSAAGGGGEPGTSAGRLSLPYLQSPFDATTGISGSGLTRTVIPITVYLYNGRSISVPQRDITFAANTYNQVWIETGGTYFVDAQPAPGVGDPAPIFVDYSNTKTKFFFAAAGASSLTAVRLLINSSFVERKGSGLPYTEVDFRREFLDIVTGPNAGIPRSHQILGIQSDYFALKYWKAFARFFLDDAKVIVERFFNTLFCTPWVASGVYSYGAKTIGADSGGGTYSGYIYSVTGFTTENTIQLNHLYNSNNNITVGTGNYETRITYRVTGFTTDVKFQQFYDYVVGDIIQMAGYHYKCTNGGNSYNFIPTFGAAIVNVSEDPHNADLDTDTAIRFERQTRTTGTSGGTAPTFGGLTVTTGQVILTLVGNTTGTASDTVPAGFAAGDATVTDGNIIWTKQTIFNPNTGAYQYNIQPTHKFYMMLTGPADPSTYLPVGLQMPDAHDSSAAVAAIACHAIAMQMQHDFQGWFQNKTRIPKSSSDFYSIEELVYLGYRYSIALNFDNVNIGLTDVFQGNLVPGGGTYQQQFLEDNLEVWQGVNALKTIYDDFCFSTKISGIDIATLRSQIGGNAAYIQNGIIGNFRREIPDRPGEYIWVYVASAATPASTEFSNLPWYAYGQAMVILLISDLPIDSNDKRAVSKFLDTYFQNWTAKADLTDFPSIALAMDFADVCTMSEILPDTLASVRSAYVTGRSGVLSFGDAVALFWFARRGMQAPAIINSRQIKTVFDYGARGDGVTNDQQAFQRAMDETAYAGYRLLVPQPAEFFSFNGGIVCPSNLQMEWHSGAWCRPQIASATGSWLSNGTSSQGRGRHNITIINPQIDGQDIDFLISQDNATGFAGGYNPVTGVFEFPTFIRIEGGHVKNWIATYHISGPGGKAVNFEEGPTDCTVDGMLAENVSIPYFVSPTGRDANKVVRRVTFKNVEARDCACLFFIINDDIRRGEYPITDPNIFEVYFQGIGRNIGHFPDARRSLGAPAVKSGAIILNGASNAFIRATVINVDNYPSVSRPAGGTQYPTGYPTYDSGFIGGGLDGPVGSVVLGTWRNCDIEVIAKGDFDDLVRIQNPASFGAYIPFRENRPKGNWGNITTIRHSGTAGTAIRTGQSTISSLTAVSGSTTQVVLPSPARTRNGEYVGMKITVLTSPHPLESKYVAAYAGPSRTVTFDSALNFAADNTSVVGITGSSRDGVGTTDFNTLELSGTLDGAACSNGTIGVDEVADGAWAILPSTASAVNDTYNGMQFQIVSALNGAGNETSVGSVQTRTVLDYVGAARKVYFSEPWSTTPNANSRFEIRNGSGVLQTLGAIVSAGSDNAWVTLPAGASSSDNHYNLAVLILTNKTFWSDTSEKQAVSTAIGAINDVQRFPIVSYVGSTRKVYVKKSGSGGLDFWKLPDNTTTFQITNNNLNQVSGIFNFTIDRLSEGKIVDDSIDTDWSSVWLNCEYAPKQVAGFAGYGPTLQNTVTNIRDGDNFFPSISVSETGARRTRKVTIADDAVASFLPSGTTGKLEIACSNGATGGTVLYKVTATAATATAGVTSDVAITTGALSAGGGTDGKLNVSAHSNGRIYLSNRLGASITIGLTEVSNL